MNLLDFIQFWQYLWYSESLLILLVAFVFNFILKWVLNRLHERFEKQKKIWRDSLVQSIYAPFSVYVWIFAIVYAINLVIPKEYSGTYTWYMHLTLSLGAIFTLAWFALRWKKKLIKLMVQKSKRREIAIDEAQLDVIDKVLTVVILFLSLMMLLEITHSSMNTLIAFGGIGGLAIAIASQEIIANFFGGLMIYATHPFAVGDWINLPERNVEGHVEEIGWYMTRVRSLEKRPLYVPNSTFSKVIVMTPSRMSHRQFKERIGLRYSDLKVVPQVIEDIRAMLSIHPDITHEQKIQVYLDSFSQNAIEISVTAYTQTIESEEFARIKQDLLLRIVDVLNNNGAEMASSVTTIDIPNRIVIKTEKESF